MISIALVVHATCGMMAVHWLTPAVFLYVVAAIVSRFWHKDMWIVYLAMAVMAAWMPHH
jgi:hypothetical protein